jgi:predicted nucleotidyltransferase component of viral defense system
MKDHLRGLLADLDAVQARNRLREYLQAAVLESLQRAGAMVALAFQGGAALRFLFGIRRHSEDLNFALERREAAYDFRRLTGCVIRDLTREGYEVDLGKVAEGRVVQSAFVRFPGLLFELGLSDQRSESLAIRIEVDSRPPGGAGLETSVVRHHRLLRLQHHDRASLLAGKLHAVLSRPYPKGRDYYDLIWYLSDRTWPEPNLTLLNNALEQTGAERDALTPRTWRQAVQSHVSGLQWPRLVADVLPFLESPEDRHLMTAETLVQLLEQRP